MIIKIKGNECYDAFLSSKPQDLTYNLLEKWLKSKIYFFQKYAIPSPVIGGLLLAFITLFLHSANIMSIQFDNTLQSFFMTIFFTSIGFNVSLKLLKKGGSKLLIFLGLATIFLILQNLIPVVLAKPLGVDIQLALMTGSTSLMGGLGTLYLYPWVLVCFSLISLIVL